VSRKIRFNSQEKNLSTFWIALVAILTALTLTVVSALELCTTACVEGQNFRILGLKFEVLGFIALPLITISHILSYWYQSFRTVTAVLLASAIGAELWFLYIQKAIIGNFCPICLGIALALFVAGGAYFFRSLKEDSMKKTFPTVSALIFGVLFAILGVSKINPLEAQQQNLKESLYFGKAESPIEVYIFTDWFCPACRKVDPEIEKMLPDVQPIAKVYFIDATVHPESLNFTPYNLSFMVNNKDQYLPIRKAVEGLSEKNKSPSDSDIKNAIEPLGAKLKELSYSDVTLGVKFFKKLVKQFDITQTPTIVVINTETKKGKKFSGSSEIKKDNILKSIESLQKKD